MEARKVIDVASGELVSVKSDYSWMVGKVYGKIRIIGIFYKSGFWFANYECLCGVAASSNCNSILRGDVISCGCSKKNPTRARKDFSFMVGLVYGKLKITDVFFNKSKKIWFANYECLCGKIGIASCSKILSGSTKSCGCSKKDYNRNLFEEKYLGKKVDNFTVTKYLRDRSSHGYFYEAVCDCGNVFEIYTGEVNIKKSCGCHIGKNRSIKIEKRLVENGIDSSRFSDLLSISNFDKCIIASWRDYRKNAIKDQKSFDLTFDRFYDMCLTPCYYCGEMHNRNFRQESFLVNGIDRKDPHIGYTESNCVSCCGSCNFIKNTLTYDDFLDFLKRFIFKEFVPLKIGEYNGKINFRKRVELYRDGNLTIGNIVWLFLQDCFYCGKTPLQSKEVSERSSVKNNNEERNGIDRVDPLKPHTLDNVVPCCRHCNSAKLTLPIDEFYRRIRSIRKHLLGLN